MEIKTLEDIRKWRDELRLLAKSIDYKEFKGQTFGSENEYTYESLIGGLESLLTDISTLLKSKNRLIKITTYNERTKIIDILSQIHLNIYSPGNLYPLIDQLKLQLRPYNLRFFEDRFIEFENEIDEARKIKLVIQQDKVTIEKKITSFEKNSETIDSQLQSSQQQFNRISEQLKILDEKKTILENEVRLYQTKVAEISKISDEASVFLETIRTKANDSAANEKLINKFAQNIQKSEENLTLLDTRIEESIQKIATYESERKEIILEAQKLIDKAREALKYTTAQGISASFQTKHDNSIGFFKVGIWLVGAGFFMLLISALSFWILLEPNFDANVLIGRILMVPVLGIGLFFCISQYNKQKTIIEDYAYKTVVATAIVGFSEQIKKHEGENTDEYVTYMKTALSEIHQDPLRKRGKGEDTNASPENIDANKMLELFKKFLEVSKAAS